MSHLQALIPVLLGCVGVAQFGGLWLAARCIGPAQLRHIDQHVLDGLLGPGRVCRVDRWVRIAPALTVVSLSLILGGLVFLWAPT